jgi:hypothetical protein
MMVSQVAGKGSLSFLQSLLFCRCRMMVNCALQPALLCIETEGAGSQSERFKAKACREAGSRGSRWFARTKRVKTLEWRRQR